MTYRRWKVAWRAAGPGELTTHDLRHFLRLRDDLQGYRLVIMAHIMISGSCTLVIARFGPGNTALTS